MGGVKKVKGVIRPAQRQELTAEGESYAEAREALLAQIPEGWEVISVMVER